MFSIPTFLWIAVVACGLLFAVPYIVGPVLVRTKFWAGAWPEVTHAFEAHHPPQVNAFFMYAEAQLAMFGFRPSGDFRIQNYMDSQVTELRTFRNENAVESAAAVCVRQMVPGGEERTVCVLSLNSEYADGRELATSNTTEIGLSPRTSRVREIRLPGVMSAETLLRVHRMCAAEFGPAPTRVLPLPGTELSAVRETLCKQTVQYAETGLLMLDQTTRRYRLTWIGAVAMCWLQLWPIKQMRLRSARNQADRLIALANALYGPDPCGEPTSYPVSLPPQRSGELG